jgi:DNA polymerase elongation subunit (family B)
MTEAATPSEAHTSEAHTSEALPEALKDEWLWGWDPAPGIVAVWASEQGRALVWRREPGTRRLWHEEARFRPWLLLASLDDLRHLGSRLQPEGDAPPGEGNVSYRELGGPGRLRFHVSAASDRALTAAVLTGASARLGKPVARLSALDEDDILHLPSEEQYLVATGRTYFRELAFDDLHRLQFDLETTGLNPAHDRIFLISVRDNRGFERVLEVEEPGRLPTPAAEAALLRRLVALVRELNPDVIENHNLQGFDLPFLARRTQTLGVSLALGRSGAPPLLRERPAARGYGAVRLGAEESSGESAEGDRRTMAVRYSIAGRELIDTLDAVRRYDFAARDLPGHGLKAVARHFGLAAEQREYIEGAHIFETWRTDPARVRHYALDDVGEVEGLARLLGGAAFALAQMAPRRYERLAEAGPATGVLDPLIARAYLRAGQALPAYMPSDGTQHSGAALYLFAAGVAHHVVKADVSSLYPSLMRQYRISPRGDHLGVLLALVDRLVEQRLAAKGRARQAPPGSPLRHTNEALSAAMKILVNSAYGYLGAVNLTRLADVHAANEVTRRGRETLDLLCRELAARGATLLEGDTDGVYFAVPDEWDEARERALVAEVGALLPPLIHLEYEGRYAAMLSHEPKNYALLSHDGELLLRGVAFRSIRAEPYGEVFLRRAAECLLRGDVLGLRAVYVEMVDTLRRRGIPTAQVSAQARLTKTPKQYLAARGTRREAVYEALLAAGRETWAVGERVRVYRAAGGRPALVPPAEGADPRDYDVAHYVRLLRETFAARLERAFTSEDFATLFADPAQPSLFAPPIEAIQAVLVPLLAPPAAP